MYREHISHTQKQCVKLLAVLWKFKEDKTEMSTQSTYQKKSFWNSTFHLCIIKKKVIPEVARDLVLNEKKKFFRSNQYLESWNLMNCQPLLEILDKTRAPVWATWPIKIEKKAREKQQLLKRNLTHCKVRQKKDAKNHWP